MNMWIYPHDRRFRHERLGMDGRQATPVSASDPRRCADLKIIADGTVQMLLDTNKQGDEQKRDTHLSQILHHESGRMAPGLYRNSEDP